jgi:hypothetical protein
MDSANLLHLVSEFSWFRGPNGCSMTSGSVSLAENGRHVKRLWMVMDSRRIFPVQAFQRLDREMVLSGPVADC